MPFLMFELLFVSLQQHFITIRLLVVRLAAHFVIPRMIEVPKCCTYVVPTIAWGKIKEVHFAVTPLLSVFTLALQDGLEPTTPD